MSFKDQSACSSDCLLWNLIIDRETTTIKPSNRSAQAVLVVILQEVMRLRQASKSGVKPDEEPSSPLLAAGCCIDFHPVSWPSKHRGQISLMEAVSFASVAPFEICIKRVWSVQVQDFVYIVGTEEGAIYKCSTAYSTEVLLTYAGHDMAVYAVRWNQVHSATFLSSSADWTVKLWHADSPKVDSCASRYIAPQAKSATNNEGSSETNPDSSGGPMWRKAQAHSRRCVV